MLSSVQGEYPTGKRVEKRSKVPWHLSSTPCYHPGENRLNTRLLWNNSEVALLHQRYANDISHP